jgi:hypothetical protein
MAANSKHGMLYHLHKAGATWSRDFGWELDGEYIGEYYQEAYNNLMKLKEKNKRHA